MTALRRLRGLPEDIKADIWANWPHDRLPAPPGPWTDAQEQAIHAAIDQRVQFDSDKDPAVMDQAKAGVVEAMKRAHLADRDQVEAVRHYAGADTSTYDGLRLLTTTLDRVAARQLLVVIDPESPPGEDRWTVIEAGPGSEIAHARAVTDMTTETGEWTCVVTCQHPTGALHSTETIRGTAAHHIAKTVLAYTDKENQQ